MPVTSKPTIWDFHWERKDCSGEVKTDTCSFGRIRWVYVDVLPSTNRGNSGAGSSNLKGTNTSRYGRGSSHYWNKRIGFLRVSNICEISNLHSFIIYRISRNGGIFE